MVSAASTSAVARASRLVVKVGSSLVTNEGRGIDHEAVARWAAQIAQLVQSGKSVILVSSGAIAEGMQRLGWTVRPRAIHALHAAEETLADLLFAARVLQQVGEQVLEFAGRGAAPSGAHTEAIAANSPCASGPSPYSAGR